MRYALALLAAAVIACGSTSSRPATPVPTTLSEASDPALAARVDAALDAAVREQRIVGGVVLVARDGRLVYHRAAGLADREHQRPMREDAIFRIASMTKPLVAVTTLALVDSGVVELDDPVTKFLTGFTPKLADGSAPPIAIRQLLTHSGGLDYVLNEPPGGPYHRAGVSDGLDAPGRTWADNQERLVSAPLRTAPGVAFHYSISIDVLGEAIAKAASAPLPDLVARTVTQPLGMSDTGFRVTDRSRLVAQYANQASDAPQVMTDGIAVPLGDRAVTFSPSRIFDPASYPSGGAGAVSTARDYLRFLEAVRTSAIGLRHDTHASLFREQLAGADPAELGPGVTFGFASSIVVDPAKADSPVSPDTLTWGGAYGSSWWIDPRARVSVVILTNTAFEGMVGRLVKDVQHAVYGR